MKGTDPVTVLLESGAPDERFEAHLALARRAVERGDPVAAAAHCEAARALRPHDPRPGELVKGLAGAARTRRWLTAARWAFRRGS